MDPLGLMILGWCRVLQKSCIMDLKCHFMWYILPIRPFSHLDLGLSWDVKTYQDPFLSSPKKLDPISSSSSSESLTTSNHVSKRKNKKKKQIQGGKPLASSHHVYGNYISSISHVGDKPLASTSHARGRTPTYRHHVGKKQIATDNHVRTAIFSENPILK